LPVRPKHETQHARALALLAGNYTAPQRAAFDLIIQVGLVL
jgi:hypothetical protein